MKKHEHDPNRPKPEAEIEQWKIELSEEEEQAAIEVSDDMEAESSEPESSEEEVSELDTSDEETSNEEVSDEESEEVEAGEPEDKSEVTEDSSDLSEETSELEPEIKRIVDELEAIGIRQIPEEALEFETKELKAPEVVLPEVAEDLEALKRTREEAEREKAKKREKITYKYRQEPSDIATSQASAERQEPYLRTRRIVQVVLLFLVGISITLVALLPEFYLESLYISGNHLLTDREILELADLESGKHLLTYVNGDIFQILTGRNSKMEARFRKEYSLIADVRCRVSFPSGFVIDVLEHQPMGVLSVPNGYAVVSGDAQVLAFRDDLPDIQVPRISGLSLRYLARGERLREEDSRVLAQALRFLDTVVRTDTDADDGFFFFPQIVEVYVDTRQRIDVSFRLPNSDRIMLARFGTGGAHSDEIYWLRHVLQTDALNEQGEGYVDLSSGEKVFVTPNRPTITETYLETPVMPEETTLEGETAETDIFGQAIETLPTSTDPDITQPEVTDEWGYPVEETQEQKTETAAVELPVD